MKIAAIGDTNGKLPKIDDSFDVFIHCGNFLPVSSDSLAITLASQFEFVENEFNSWLDSIDSKVKIVMPGFNDYACGHNKKDFDFFLHGNFVVNELMLVNKIYFYCMPYISLQFLSNKHSVFQSPSQQSYKKLVTSIPNDTNILITRMPHTDKGIKRKINILPKFKHHIFSCEGVMSSRLSTNVFSNDGTRFFKITV